MKDLGVYLKRKKKKRRDWRQRIKFLREDFKCNKKSKKFCKSFTIIKNKIIIYQNINIRNAVVRNERHFINLILNQIK